LRDGRRILFSHGSGIHLVDSSSKRVHEVFSVAPQEVQASSSVSLDNRWIYFSKMNTEGDIWLADLGKP
jgi:hypothetical protein